jgi:hypothetical protein
VDAIASESVVSELLSAEIAQAGDDTIAARTGSENGGRLDQRDIEVRIRALERARTARARKTATYDHDARLVRCAAAKRKASSCSSGKKFPALQIISMPWFLSGKVRMRLPVARV